MKEKNHLSSPEHDINFKKALNYAFLLLKYRLRSEKELFFRLKRKKFSSSLIKEVILYLKRHNYLNDFEFAEAFISSKINKKWPKEKIRQSLRKFYLDNKLIEELLSKIDEEIIIKQAADDILKKITSSGKKIDSQELYKIKQHIFHKLAMKGFDYETIKKVLERISPS